MCLVCVLYTYALMYGVVDVAGSDVGGFAVLLLSVCVCDGVVAVVSYI